MANYCIILAGGMGNRLWPMSRSAKPKQYLDLLGTGRTLLQDTYDRMERIFGKGNIIISTCEDQMALVCEQLPDHPKCNILAEPLRRGTMPAAFWANTVLLERDADAHVVCTPADQIVLREHQFEEDIREALVYVAKRRDNVLTLGVRPTRAETFYGYLQAEYEDNDTAGFALVKAFTEKPSLEFAQMFVNSGEFYWNTGINAWNCRSMQDKLKCIEPDYADMLRAERDKSGEKMSQVVGRCFGSLPNMSLDLTIQERMCPVHLRICNFGWADIGNWHSMHDDLPGDKSDNVVLHSTALLYNCSGNVIKMPRGTTIVMQDIHDKVVVEHDGILFIAPKDSYGEMRRVMTDAQMKIRS